MGCFVVPVTEAVVTTVATKVLEKRENKKDIDHIKVNRFSAKLKKLNHLLWGGSALLAFEHVYHGELQPFFPFLTAMESSEATASMLHEMSTAGVTMAISVTAVWAVGLVVEHIMSKKGQSVDSKIGCEIGGVK